ncbi:MAG: EAL domain-containing protein [Gammaproteobacteria bacterium]|nr:EAL domain-containing protein [Gammaproteobacteria bacterium]
MFKAIVQFLCLCAVELGSIQPSHAEAPLSMAILSFRPQETLNQKWHPLAEYLSEKLERKVVIASYTYDELELAAQSNKIDIILTNPAHYILLRHRNNLSTPLVTQITHTDGHDLTVFGGVMFTRSDNTDIASAYDISNKTVAATTAGALGGYKMQAFELLEHGIKPIAASKLQLTGMPHDKVVDQVLHGHAEVGFVRTGILESMVAEGKIVPDSYKIINAQDLPAFPYATSTRLYPEWPIAVMPSVSGDLTRQLMIALLSIQKDDDWAKKAGIAGFNIAANYSGVDNILRALRAEPYNIPSSITVHDLWEDFATWMVAVFALFTLLIMTSIKVFYSNITIKRANNELRLFKRIFDTSNEGIIITNDQVEMLDVNPAFIDITGYSRDDVIGQNTKIRSSGKHKPEFYQAMWQAINEHSYWKGEVWNRKKGGEIYPELLSISVLKNKQDEITNYVAIFSDLTSSHAHQKEKLNWVANHDILTGLPNRTLLADAFHQAITHIKHTTQCQLAVCFLDLDNFKQINDTYGVQVGDQLLVEVAKRISATIGEEDTVSRIGGDEFALLLNDIKPYDQSVARIEQLLHVLAQPYIIDGEPLTITASIGLTLYPDDGEDIDTLIRHAHNAMYQAKQSGKHRYHMFDSQHDNQLIQKYHKLDEIQKALINHEFRLYYQPKVNMVTGEVFGAEALIRWHHPEQGLIPPLDFLSVIDDTDLECQIGMWVINQTLKQMESWLAQDIELQFSVNITAHHLQSDRFINNLEASLARYPAVDSTHLQLEILESGALSDLETISGIIKTCQQALGVKIALDDFGTGYSSLTHMRNLTVDTIKMDQSFVKNMINDPGDLTIIDGIIGLTEAFGREVIAEGVETTEHGLMLLIMGCKQAQGYGIAKPIPADKFPAWLSQYKPNQQWLECGHQVLTVAQRKTKLFRLLIEHWLALFVSNIQSSPQDIKHWPIIDNKHDPCGQWIMRERKQSLFTRESLNRLDKAHQHFHLVAQAIHHQYQQGDVDAARNALPELQSVFDKVSNAVGLCE